MQTSSAHRPYRELLLLIMAVTTGTVNLENHVISPTHNKLTAHSMQNYFKKTVQEKRELKQNNNMGANPYCMQMMCSVL